VQTYRWRGVNCRGTILRRNDPNAYPGASIRLLAIRRRRGACEERPKLHFFMRI